MKSSLARMSSSSSLLKRLVEMPDLPAVVRALPTRSFAALVRRIGVEDAAEIVALATTEQLVAAFDEDLFHGAPGDRETFDAERFVRWIEAMLEAGDHVAAERVSELSEDFVVHALDAVSLVLDHDALRDRIREDDDDGTAERADKALESALSEEIDGYLLVARVPDAWDAVIALILALDRDRRPWLERILDRAARLSSALVDDLDSLSSALSAGASLAEDVEAEREERRSAAGFVEPRAARAFLRLARDPEADAARDASTRAYFRALVRQPLAPPPSADAARALAWLEEPELGSAARRIHRSLPARRATTLVDALQALGARAPVALDARVEELAYLANVLVAGASTPKGRYRPIEAAEAALATVTLGVALAVGGKSADAWAMHLEREPADLAFRRASAALVRAGLGVDGVLLDRADVPAALSALGPKKRRSA